MKKIATARTLHVLALLGSLAVAAWAQTAASPPASAAASATPPASASSPMLHLLANPEVLPAGRAGVPYKPVRVVLGGVPGYTIRISDGQLPEGMALSVDGTLSGTPKSAGSSRFSVRATDSSHPPETAQRTYTLRILPVSAARPASAASAPGPAPVTAVTLSSDATPSAAPAVMSFKLLAADLDAVLVDPNASAADAQSSGDAQAAAPAATPASAAASDAPQGQAEAEPAAPVIVQQRQMLEPLVGQEFPTQAMFERALEMRACTQARAIVMQAEKERGLTPQAAAITCPPWPVATTSAPKPKKGASQTMAAASAPASAIPVEQLPSQLLPDDLRTQLITKATRLHPLDRAVAAVWDGSGCGCVYDDLSGDIYGLYPFWAASGKPQPVNFALLTAIGYHAATFGDDGVLLWPAGWDSSSREIARVARRHNTRLDLVIWRNQWASLPTDDAKLERVATELARGAMQALETPAADPGDNRWSRYLPMLRSNKPLASGITLFFDAYPAADKPGAAAFASFTRKVVGTLIAQLRRTSSRDFTLNLVIPQDRIGKPPFEYETLFDYLKRAEDPRIVQERIALDGDNYLSNTNVTLKLLVLLPESTSKTKKELRQDIEKTPGIFGNDRRVMLRKMIPVVAYNGADPAQFADDVAYFSDNFGGVGFWPMPLVGEGVAADIDKTVAHAFRKNPDHETTAICRIVCTNRGWVHAIFYLLVGIELLALAGVAAIGGFRCLSKTTWAALLFVAICTFALGGAMLNCDPELRALREGNSLLWLGIVIFIGSSIYATFVPRDPTP